MSLEGGFELLEEFFERRATWADSSSGPGRQLGDQLLQLGDAELLLPDGLRLLPDDPLVVLFGAGIHGSFGRQVSDTPIIGPTAATNPVLPDFDLHLPGGYTLLIRLTGSLFGHKAVNGY